VTKGERLVGEAALCALYLRGAPYASGCERRRWPLVADALLSLCPDVVTLSDALRSRGLYDEAAFLSPRCVTESALALCASGRVVTYLDPSYPRGWVESLGTGAPPCAWVHGALPVAPGVGVVGSRVLDHVDRSFAAGAGRLLMRTGRTLVTGGAVGADSVALSSALACGGASRCVVLLPYGLDQLAPEPGVCYVSVCEPSAPFSTGQAMERNALIYAYGRRTVVVRARYRAGGTWHGASDALRRRLGAVYVRERSGDRAGAALCALGGVPLSGLGALAAALDRPLVPPQPALFGSSVVREQVGA
jgi:hypothetical protein